MRTTLMLQDSLALDLACGMALGGDGLHTQIICISVLFRPQMLNMGPARRSRGAL